MPIGNDFISRAVVLDQLIETGIELRCAVGNERRTRLFLAELDRLCAWIAIDDAFDARPGSGVDSAILRA